MSLYEAAALGVNMSVPYGSWMGAVIEDAFYAPHDLCVEVQDFLAGHEQLYSTRTHAEVGVVYSIRSVSELIARRDAFADNRTNVSGDVAVPFDAACRALTDGRQPYDVVFFPDGELRPDALTADDVRRYRTLVLPGCSHLTEAQAALLLAFLDGGGHVVAIGELGEDLPAATRDAILGHAGASTAAALDVAGLPDGPQVAVDAGRSDFAICVQAVEAGAALHLIRYDHDDAADAVPPLPELQLDLRLPFACSRATAFSPGGDLGVALEAAGTAHRLRLTDVPLYGVVLLEP
jgi:hypothetical protein